MSVLIDVFTARSARSKGSAQALPRRASEKQRRSRCSGASDVLAEITDEIRSHCVRTPPPLAVH